MGFKCGIVGLPNVGKSTLFNALTATQAAEAANYPFCTIEPNVGQVGVPDKRLDKLAELAKSAKVIPTQLEFVDIAGLVKGASKGEGLGNQFLSHIREVDAILHVLRCFHGEVTHVDGSVDPLRDRDTIETELMLADLDSVEKRIPALEKRIKGNDQEAKELLTLLKTVYETLANGEPARNTDIPPGLESLFKTQDFITAKPILYVCNVADEDAATGNDLSKKITDANPNSLIISADIEAELANLPDDEKQEFLSDLGLNEGGLPKLIRAGYGLLDLITFFTVGPKEARAWTCKKGSTAPEAAGKIHTDFMRGFIRAETIHYDDYIAAGSEQAAKDQGKLRIEGKDYVAQDGDIFHFRFNV